MMRKCLILWRTWQDSNLRPLPSEGSSDRQIHPKPLFRSRFDAGLAGAIGAVSGARPRNSPVLFTKEAM